MSNRIPLVGGWLRLDAARLLSQAAGQGNPQAARILAMALVSDTDPQVIELIKATLAELSAPASLDAIWTAWIDTRSPGLLQILLDKDWVATAPPKARVISALRLQRLDLIEKGGVEIIRPLVEALADANPEIQQQARICLQNLTTPDAVDALWEHWLSHRETDLQAILIEADYPVSQPPAVVYRALLREDTQALRQAPAQWIPTLLDACQESDRLLRRTARQALEDLQDPQAIDAVCQSWAKNRKKSMTAILRARHYLPQSLGEARVFCALTLPAPELYPVLQASEIPVLLSAHADPELAGEAEKAARSLTDIASIEALCQAAAEQGDMFARQVCLEMDFAPAEPQARALFFFMTGQWDRFQALDFDLRLLRSAFEAADYELRARITRQIQRSGRLDFLPVLVVNETSSARLLDDGEIDVLLHMLVEHRSWERIWSLAFDLPVLRSLDCLRALAASGWTPPDEQDQPVFSRLCELAEKLAGFDPSLLERASPPLHPRAHLRVSGRINGVAFDPLRPIIAIATGNRKVALWDFQQAEIVDVLNGFSHSVGRVAYTKNGCLLAAERTNTTAECRIYVCDGGKAQAIGEHFGSVTALEPAGDTRLLSTGKDGQAILWELPAGRVISRKNLNFWPRAARVAPDGRQAALLDQGLAMITLPDLDFIGGASHSTQAGNGWNASGVSRSAVFIPGTETLVLGKSNGRLVVYTHLGKNYRADRRPALILDAEIQGLEYLAGHAMLVSATARGQILYSAWPSREQIAETRYPGERLTSLCFSADQAFFSTGDSNAATALWDLRALELPALVKAHLSTFTVHQQGLIQSLTDNSEVPAGLVDLVAYMDTVLAFRNRYDIQVSDVPLLKAGEFDIQID